jgi:anaerobic selenocysteine-containing dehydrogenase
MSSNFLRKKIAEVTWVKKETIQALARLYATSGPATIIQGGNALDQHSAGFQTERALALLMAVTGNIDVPGGQISASIPPMNELRLPEMLKERPLGADAYPLILTTGARLLAYHQSKYRNLSKLRRISPEALAELHPDTAQQYGVSDGDLTVVETPRGKIEIKAKATPNILPGVIHISHGWENANINLLTDEKPADPVTGYPSLKSGLCSIRKKS